jgi:hypothetical protein
LTNWAGRRRSDTEPKAECREQRAEKQKSRKQKAEGREQKAEGRRQKKAENERQKAESRSPTHIRHVERSARYERGVETSDGISWQLRKAERQKAEEFINNSTKRILERKTLHKSTQETISRCLHYFG